MTDYVWIQTLLILVVVLIVVMIIVLMLAKDVHQDDQ